MAFFNRGIATVALLAALGACASASETPQVETAMAPAAAKSALDTAIETAGGEAVLSKIRELEWTGTATVNAAGQASVVNVATVVRPAGSWLRTTTWAKDAAAKTGKTTQSEQGKAWAVNRVSWVPMPEGEATHEYQQSALYSLMLLAPLKAEGGKASEAPAGADGLRVIKGVLPDGRAGELKVDASGKLVGATLSVKNPKGGADQVQTAKFSGEIVSNGVKWPKRITIEQDGAPYYDLEIATFEASTAAKPRPLPHTLDEDDQPPPARGGGGG